MVKKILAGLLTVGLVGIVAVPAPAGAVGICALLYEDVNFSGARYTEPDGAELAHLLLLLPSVFTS